MFTQYVAGRRRFVAERPRTARETSRQLESIAPGWTILDDLAEPEELSVDGIRLRRIAAEGQKVVDPSSAVVVFGAPETPIANLAGAVVRVPAVASKKVR